MGKNIIFALIAGVVGVPTVFYAASVVTTLKASPAAVQSVVNVAMPAAVVGTLTEFSVLKSLLTTNVVTFTLLKERATFDIAAEVTKCGSAQNASICFHALRTRCANLVFSAAMKGKRSPVTAKQKANAKESCNEYVEIGSFFKDVVTCDAITLLKDKRKCIRTLWVGSAKDRIKGKENDVCKTFTSATDRDRCFFAAVLANGGKDRSLCAKISSPDFREACETE